MKRRINLWTCSRNEKTVEHESDVYTNCNWSSWYCHQRIIKGTGGFGNKRTSGDYPNYYIIEIGQNTEKGPGDLRRLAVIQTSMKDHQHVKNSQGLNNNNDDDSWCSWNSLQRPGKETGVRTRDKRKTRDHPDHSTVKISKNTLKSPKDQARLTVTQNSVKNKQS